MYQCYKFGANLKMYQCYKFGANPSNTFQDIVWTLLRMHIHTMRQETQCHCIMPHYVWQR